MSLRGRLGRQRGTEGRDVGGPELDVLVAAAVARDLRQTLHATGAHIPVRASDDVLGSIRRRSQRRRQSKVALCTLLVTTMVGASALAAIGGRADLSERDLLAQPPSSSTDSRSGEPGAGSGEPGGRCDEPDTAGEDCAESPTRIPTATTAHPRVGVNPSAPTSVPLPGGSEPGAVASSPTCPTSACPPATRHTDDPTRPPFAEPISGPSTPTTTPGTPSTPTTAPPTSNPTTRPTTNPTTRPTTPTKPTTTTTGGEHGHGTTTPTFPPTTVPTTRLPTTSTTTAQQEIDCGSTTPDVINGSRQCLLDAFAAGHAATYLVIVAEPDYPAHWVVHEFVVTGPSRVVVTVDRTSANPAGGRSSMSCSSLSLSGTAAVFRTASCQAL